MDARFLCNFGSMLHGRATVVKVESHSPAGRAIIRFCESSAWAEAAKWSGRTALPPGIPQSAVGQEARRRPCALRARSGWQAFA